MTMPHLQNCSHDEDGWCLDCVKELWEEKEVWRAKAETANFQRSLAESARKVDTWPAWKRDLLGDVSPCMSCGEDVPG